MFVFYDFLVKGIDIIDIIIPATKAYIPNLDIISINASMQLGIIIAKASPR